LRYDLRFALRGLRANLRFATAAIFMLALGIGASTIIFSVVDSVLLEPFAYKNVHRLVVFHIHFPGAADSDDRSYFGGPEFLDFKQQNHVFEDLIGMAGRNVMYSGPQQTQRFDGALVSSNAFEILGIKPLLGRPLIVADGDPGAPPVFAMSYSLWSKQFNRDPKLLGATLRLNGQPRTLVAIVPSQFNICACDIWLPVTIEKADHRASSHESGPWFWPIGLLKPGVTEKAAAADLDVIARRLAKIYPGGYLREFSAAVETYTDVSVGDFRALLWMLLAAVFMLLLIACTNVAILLLSRSSTREREIAIRASVGGSPARLVRQLLVESSLLAIAGGIAGCSFAYFGLRLAVAEIPPETIPADIVIAIKPAVLCFAIGVTFLTTLLSGLAPAMHVVRNGLNLRVAGAGKNNGGSAPSVKLRGLLVIAEVGLSLVLLTGAGLMMRTMLAVQRVNLGFNPANMLFTRLIHAQPYTSPAEKYLFYQTVLDRVTAIPAVKSATIGFSVPPYSTGLTDVSVAGRERPESASSVSEMCSEDYLQTFGIPLLRGRFFSRQDIASANPVVVVNKAFAREFFSNSDAIGQKLKFPSWELNYSDWPRGAYFEVIGIIGDVKNKTLRQATAPQIYLPYTLSATGLADDRVLIVKTFTNAQAALPVITDAIHKFDPDVVIAGPGTIEQSLHDDAYGYAGPRFALFTVSAFAIVGLVLVASGIFSVMAYTMSQRTHEIGVRIAVGAQRGDILRMVLRSGVLLIGAGVAAGLLTSVALARLLASQIWGVSATDPWTFAAALTLLIVVGLAACLVPARRAALVDPMIALRHE
jgi:putative ABC transport system permease protein